MISKIAKLVNNLTNKQKVFDNTPRVFNCILSHDTLYTAEACAYNHIGSMYTDKLCIM